MKKMKVGELRNELKSFTQEELIELVVSLYKQHAEVKTTLNGYFIEEFEGDVMNQLRRDIVSLGERASYGSNNLPLLKERGCHRQTGRIFQGTSLHGRRTDFLFDLF